MAAGSSGGAPADGALVIVGRVRKPQGLHGEVLVEPLTDTPDAVFASGVRLQLGTSEGDPFPDAPTLTPVRARPFKNGYLVRFVEAATRDDVEPWRGRYLLAPADSLPAPAADEVYLHELLGMRVVDDTAGEIGLVGEIYELPQGLALEISGARTPLLIPYRPELVTEVDVEQRIVRVRLPSGLLD